MLKLEEKLVTDKAGQGTDVILSRKDYEKLMEQLRDLEDCLEIKQRRKNAKFVAWEKVKADLKRNGKR